MTSEVTKVNGGELPTVPADSFLAVIAAAARDPQVDVAKMQQLLEMRQKVRALDAEQEYNAAMARVQPQLPRIQKNGRISINSNNSQPFAKYEDINKAVRPILASEGFSVSYSFEETDKGAVCHCTISHREGHSKTTSTPPLPTDKSGSKNSVQAVGSTMSYAKRYALCNALDIVTVDQDDDGHAAGVITEEQANRINDMMAACEMSLVAQAAFLKLIGTKTVEDLPRHRYDDIMEALRKKLAQKGGSR